MKLINQITNSIVNNAKNGETIHSLAKRIGFAYSAVYKWITILEDYEVINLIRKGNKNIIKINKNNIFNKFIELDEAINVIEKDKIFWNLVKKTKLGIRFVQSTAVVIWTQGSYITGDFIDRVYFLEVNEKDLTSFKNDLEKYNITYSEEKIIEKRPFIFIIPNKEFKIERKNNLQVMPLSELVKWCKRLYLDNVLEQLDSMYNLNLNIKYSEIKTNF